MHRVQMGAARPLGPAGWVGAWKRGSSVLLDSQSLKGTPDAGSVQAIPDSILAAPAPECLRVALRAYRGRAPWDPRGGWGHGDALGCPRLLVRVCVCGRVFLCVRVYLCLCLSVRTAW